MANANDILAYLPNSFKTRDEQDYINFLWESYESNYNNGKFPFAFIAFHMLYMSFVYFEVWQIKENRTEDFQKSLIAFSKDNEKMMLDATTPFAFVEIGESNFIRFLKLIGCDNEKIGSYCSSVKSRNDAAHSNGRIFFNASGTVDTKTTEILRHVDEIQILSHPVIDECLIQFLKNSWNPDDREYIGEEDQIREILIHGNYLSQKDIEHMLTFDITQLSAEPNYTEMETLFNAFKTAYATT
jgi:Trp operon repressor